MMAILRLLSVALLAVVSVLAFAQADAPLRTISPGDTIQVAVEEIAEVSKEYVVTDDGFIQMTFVGLVEVRGLSEAQAADRISKRLTEEAAAPKATVVVTILREQARGVKFSGAVARSGETTHRDDLRLAEVIRIAEPLETADLSQIQVRSLDGQTVVVDFTKFDPATNAGNPLLKPGDEVVFLIKERPDVVFVLGAVGKPGGIELKSGMTARQAIEAAGGFSTLAVTERVRLERDGQEAVVLDLSAEANDAPLRANDRIVVEARSQRVYVQVAGAVRDPRFIEFRPGLTLGEALRAAGGPATGARLDRVKLTSTGEPKRTVDYRQIEQGFRGDMVLKPGDRIDVPGTRRTFDSRTLIAVGAAILWFLFGR